VAAEKEKAKDLILGKLRQETRDDAEV